MSDDRHSPVDHGDEANSTETTNLIQRQPSSGSTGADDSKANTHPATTTQGADAAGAGNGESGGERAAAETGASGNGEKGRAVTGAGILKPSRSSSNLLTEISTEPQRPSSIHRSLSHHFKRVSIGGDQTHLISAAKSIDKSTDDGGASETSPVIPRRRSTVKRSSGYGTIYPPIYQKLSNLHRLSFADVVERITLTWENINVYSPSGGGPPGGKAGQGSVSVSGLSASGADVPNLQQKHILKDISGAVEPGTLLAVMGASGSGKTTLLNVLTYRNRGNLTVMGEVRVNGGIIGKAMSSLSGYIQQEDMFIGTLTVSEHLWFQSKLKMDKDIPDDIRADRVAEVMKEMSLTKCANVLIGIPGKIKGISGGEKKRLAFASEVITNPPMLFLDEPTSGLDSYMAQNILKTLKVMAAKGRTIVCTIHQPSSEVFELFDRLLLVAEGRVAYLGPAGEASEFFAGCGYKIPPNYNPADYFVRTLAIEPGNEEQCRDKVKLICDSYEVSPQADRVRKVIGEANFHEDGAMYEEDSFAQVSAYKASWFTQFYVLLWRCGLNNFREPAIFRTRLFQVTVLAFIFGLVYWQQPLDQLGLANINGALFLMETQMTFGFIFNVIMTFPPEHPVFLREHFDGMYRVDVYFLCKTMAEVPQFILLPLLFSIIMFFCVGLYSSVEGFFIVLACNFLVCNVSVSFGYLLSCATSNVSLALAIAPLFVVPCSMIGGFFINPETIPVYFIWLKYLSWFTYANEILFINQWSHVTSIACSSSPNNDGPNILSNVTQSILSTVMPTTAGVPDSERCISTGKAVLDMYGYKESNMAFDFGMLVVLLVAFRMIAFLLLLYRSRKTYKISSNKKP